MAQLDFRMNLQPELDVAKLNAALKAMKAAMGDMGKGIQLIDEGKLRQEYALIDAAVKKATESTRQMADQADRAGKEFAGIPASIKNIPPVNIPINFNEKETAEAIRRITKELVLMKSSGKMDTKEYDRLSQKLLELKGQQQAFTNAVKGTNTEFDNVTKEATQLETALSKAADKGTLLGKVFAFNQFAQGIQMATAAFAPFLDAFVEFDQQIQNVGTLGVKNLDDVRSAANEISKQVPGDAATVTNAIYQMVSAGTANVRDGILDMASAQTFVTAAAQDAVSGLSDVSTATNLYTSVLNAYGKKAEDVGEISNATFAAIKLGKTTFEELSSSTATWLPVAANAGVAADEVFAAISRMTATGTPTAQAATQIRAAMVLIQKGGPGLNKALKEQGRSLEEFQQMMSRPLEEGGGFINAMKGIREVIDNAGMTMPAATGRIEAANAILSLTGDNLEATQELYATFRSEVERGVATEAFAAASQSVAAQTEGIASSIQAMFNDVFQAIGTQGTTALKVLTDFSPAIMSIGMLGPMVGGLGSGFTSLATNLLTRFVPSVITTNAATGAATVSFKALSVALLTNPFTIAIVGAVALGVALYALSNALRVTAAEQLEEKKAELELNKAQEETLIKRKKLAESNIGLIDEYGKLKAATKGTVEDTEQYGNMLLKLAQRYPGVIDSSKSYEENLAALKIESAEATKELGEMEKQMEALQKGTARLEYEVAVSEVNVKAEEIEDAISDAMGTDFWGTVGNITGVSNIFNALEGKNITDIGGAGFLDATAAVKSVKESTDAIKKAWTDAEIGKAVVKAQTDFINDPRFKYLTAEEKKIIFDKIAEEGELQRTAAKAKNENRYMDEKLDLSKRVQLYVENAEEISKIEIKVKQGTATDEDTSRLAKLKDEQTAASAAIQAEFNKLKSKGVDVTAVIAQISKTYGMTKDKVIEIVGVQGEMKDSIEGAADAAMGLAEAYKAVGDAVSGAFNQSKNELTFAKQIKALKQSDYEDRMNRLRDSGNEEDRQAAEQMEKVREMSASDIAAIKKKTDEEFKTYKVLKDTEKTVNEMYSLEKKKSGTAATLLQTLEKELGTRKKAIDNELEMTEIAVELARLQSGREKSVYDEIAAQERKLQSIEAQKKAFEDIYKITKSETGAVAVGVALKEDEKAKIAEDYNNLVNQIGSESNKSLEITLKAKADFDKTALEIAEGVAALNLERLRYEIEIGLQPPEAALPILLANLEALRKELEAKQAESDALKLKIDMAADPKERQQLEADLQKISKAVTDISKKELDATKELSGEQKKVSDARISLLQREHDEQMKNIQAQIDEEKRLNQIRLSIASRIADAANAARKDAELTALDKKFGKYEEETDEERQYREQKAQIELDYNNRAKSVADAARGAELEAERQQTILLLSEQKKRTTALLSEAEKAGDKAKVQELTEQLTSIDKGITDQSSLIIAHSSELKDSVTAIFTSLLGDEESLKAPWRQLLGVVAGGLKQYLSLLATQLVFGEIAKYSSTGLIALLLIPAFQGLVNAALNAILDPILSGVASFSTGGRVDEPTFAIVGDASNARPGADTEWIFRDDQLKAMMADIVTKNLSGVADMFRQLAAYEAANFDIARLGVDNAAVLTRTLIEQGIGRDVTIEKLHEKETVLIKEVLAKGTEAEKQYLSLSKGNVMLQELGSISITNIVNKNLMYGAIEELPVNDGMKQLLQRSMPGSSNAEIVGLLESLNSKVKQLDALNQQGVRMAAAMDRQNELSENLNRLPEQLEALRQVNKNIEALPATVQITQDSVGTAANRYNRGVSRRVRT